MPRIFFAVPLSGVVKDKLVVLQHQLMQKPGAVKWVEKENLHLTLLFIGEVTPEKLKTVIAAASGAAAASKPFTMEVKGYGAFPGLKNPRVLWAGVGSGVTKVASLVSTLSERVGVSHDKPYTAHITLGRIRDGWQFIPDETLEYRRFEAGTVMVDKFLCLESKLTPRGPVYSEVAVFKLHDF